MTKQKSDRLTLDQLHTTQVFADLTPKQQKLVDAFISSNGNRTASVMAAYETKSERNAQIMAYQLFASPRVVAALAAYFQDDPLESFKAEVRAAYHNKKLTVAQVRAMALHAELNGWGSASLPNLHGRDFQPEPSNEPEVAEPVTPTQVYTVGQRVTQRDAEGVEHVGVVKAVDAAGFPTEIEEVL